MLGARLQGKRMGIVGMGRIGQALARRARGFGLAIHYHNRKRVHADIERELEATYWESLDQMLARMDIVSVNCPHTPATYHLLSARRLKLMKPTAIIVNTARGEVIDENALVRMLKAGELAGAGLDVYEHEPQVNPEAARARQRRAAAAHGLGHARGPHRDGREGPDQHQDLRRRPQAAGPRAGDDVLSGSARRGRASEAREPRASHTRRRSAKGRPRPSRGCGCRSARRASSGRPGRRSGW